MTTTVASVVLSTTTMISNSSISCLVCRSFASTLLFSFIFALIVLIGIFGNAFVVIVIVSDRKLLASSVNQFLLNLAIADIGHLLFCSPDMALVIVDQGWILPHISCRIIRFLQEYFLYSSVLLQVGFGIVFVVVLFLFFSHKLSFFSFKLLQMSIGIERFMAICSPLRMQRFSRKTTIVVALIVWLVALAFATPYFLWQGVLVSRNNFFCGWDRDISKDFKTVFKWSEFVGLYAFPLILLTVLYTIMGRVLWGTTGDAIADETQQAAILKLRRTVVKMLIISMLLYFLCYTPIQGIFIWESIYKRPIKMPSWLRLALNAFSVSSSSANPFIYILCCRHFHARFVSLSRSLMNFCRLRNRNQKYACVVKETQETSMRFSRSPYVSFRKSNKRSISTRQQVSLL